MKLRERIQVLFQLHEEGDLTSDQVIEIIKRWSEESSSILNEPFVWYPFYYGRFPEDSSAGDPTPPFVTECETGGWTLTFDPDTNETTETKDTIVFETSISPETKKRIASLDPFNPDTIYFVEIDKEGNCSFKTHKRCT